MIDTHCHLESDDYNNDFDSVITALKSQGVRAVVSVATKPEHFEKALSLVSKYNNFLFIAAGIHPEYVKELSDLDIEEAIKWLRLHSKSLVGIGEQGLDYNWVKEPELQNKQRTLFARMIELSKELNKVTIVHSRDAGEDTVRILEENNARRVHLHMWGYNDLMDKVVKNGWYISVGPVIATSKKHKKVVRDMPLDRIMLETDSPWFGGKDESGNYIRGTPANIIVPAKEIAEIKGISVEEVLRICAENAIRLYSLPLKV